MGYDLTGKRVLVTGASSGIGAALAVGFARRGATVGICARRQAGLDATLAAVREFAPDSRAWSVDLADLEGIAAFATRVVDELGGVDVLVNNAGIPKRRGLTDLDPATVEAVMSINYFSPVRLTLALLPELIARSGRIVTISSVAARLSPPHEGAYGASKSAISTFMECAHIDLALAGHDVRVLLVNPGVIDTELFHLPDNEPSMAPLDALPVGAIVEPVLGALEADTREIFVPEWFQEIAAGKAGDVGAFLDGSIAWARGL